MALYPVVYNIVSQRELISSISFQPPLYNFNVPHIAYLLDHALVKSLLQYTYTWFAYEIPLSVLMSLANFENFTSETIFAYLHHWCFWHSLQNHLNDGS